MKKFFLLLLLAAAVTQTQANNVQISNVSVVNSGQGNVKIEFDLSWDNSWRVSTAQNNYDGVWVYFKYRKKGSTEWNTLYLAGANNSSSSVYSIYQRTEEYVGKPNGAIIYRASNGAGTVNFSDIQLGAFSLPYNVDIKAFAVEMVYVPATVGVFSGDGNGTNESTNAFHSSDNRYANTFLIPTQSFLLSIATDANSFDDDNLNWQNGKELYLTDSGYAYSNSRAARVTTWPTEQAFWCMKYEISQGAYRDFLNSLTQQQQTTRTAVATTSARGTVAMVASGSPVKSFIKIDAPSTGTTPAVYGCDANSDGTFNGANDGEWESCGYLSYPDVAAYLAWSGLAPMTEIMFERACRGYTDAGYNEPIYGEYAWGTNQIISSRFTLSNANATNEMVSNMAASADAGYANYFHTSPNGTYAQGAPLRNGIFAAFTGGDRITSGSSFFGIMEMSGNLSEVCVTLGNNQGRVFKGLAGGGGLTVAGNASGRQFWPGTSSNPADDVNSFCSSCDVTFSAGTITRGGNFMSGESFLRIADRSQGAGTEIRLPTHGGRGVLYLRN